MDLWAIIDGRIVVGEATTSGFLGTSAKKEGRRLERIRRIVNAVTADELVFATTCDVWNPSTRNRIESMFKNHSLQLRLIERLGTPQNNQAR